MRMWCGLWTACAIAADLVVFVVVSGWDTTTGQGLAGTIVYAGYSALIAAAWVLGLMALLLVALLRRWWAKRAASPSA